MKSCVCRHVCTALEEDVGILYRGKRKYRGRTTTIIEFFLSTVLPVGLWQDRV